MFNLRNICLATLAVCASISASPFAATGTSSSAAAASATPVYGQAKSNLIYAQQLVYTLLDRHRDLDVVGIHGIPPQGGNGTTIAINLDRIGKPDDSDDDAVAVDHKTIMAPNAKDPSKFEIAIPMHNKAGKMLNASINLVFQYTAGDDQLALHGKAVAYRDEVANDLTSYSLLFKPVKALNISKC